MATLDDLLALSPRLRKTTLARYATDPELIEELALEEAGGEAPMGLLARLGRILDWPGRQVRYGISALLGRPNPEATGRDILSELGIVGRYNRPGLDLGDVAGFGAEVVTDPLTYLTGVGGLTKAGKAASRARGARDVLADLSTRYKGTIPKDVATRAKLRGEMVDLVQSLKKTKGPGGRPLSLLDVGKAVGDPKKLPSFPAPLPKPSFVDQLRSGERAALTFGVPFTGREAAVGTNLPASLLERAGGAAEALADAPGVRQLLEGPVGRGARGAGEWFKKAFVPMAGVPSRARARFEGTGRAMREAVGEIPEASAEIQQTERGLVDLLGMEPEEVQRSLFKATESVGQPEALEALAVQAGKTARATADEVRGRLRERVLEPWRDRTIQGISRDAERRQKELWRRTGKEAAEEEALLGSWRKKSISQVTRDLEAKKKALWKEWYRRGQLREEVPKFEARVAKLEEAAQREISELETALPRWAKGQRRQAAAEAEAQGIAAGAARRLEDVATGTPGWFQRREAREVHRATKDLEEEMVSLREKAKKPAEALAGTPREIQGAAQGLAGKLDRLKNAELFAGARGPGDVLAKDAPIRYMYRVISPQAQKWLQERRLEGEFASRLGESARVYSTRTKDQLRRKDYLYDLFTEEANAFFREKGFEGEWFNLDPSTSWALRQANGKVAIANAHLWRGLVEDFAASLPEGAGMKVEEFLERGPLHGGVAEGLLEKYAGKSIPRPVAEEALRRWERISSPKALSQLLGTYDTVTRALQTLVTVPFPGFHLRNLLSDTMLSFLGGGADPREMMPAFRDAWDRAWNKRAEALNVYRGTRGSELGLARRGLERGPMGLTTDVAKQDPIRKAGQEALEAGAKEKLTPGTLAQFVERFTRTWHFRSMRRQGLSEIEAAARVRRDLLDYGNLTDFERQGMKRVFFFYNWPRQVIPRIIEAYFETPQRMGLLSRATTQPTIAQDNPPVPEWIRTTAAVPIGRNAEGSPRYLTGLGSPLEELNLLDPTSLEGGGFGTARKVLTKLGGRLNPLIKYPAELAAGREFFYDRPLLQADRAEPIHNLPGLKQLLGTSVDTTASGETRFRADPYALHALRALPPVARGLRELGRVGNLVAGGDPRRSKLEDVLSVVAGVKTQSVQDVDALRTVEEMLKRQATGMQRSGEMGQIPVFFAREKDGEKSPEAQDLLKRSRLLRQIINARQKAQEARSP